MYWLLRCGKACTSWHEDHDHDCWAKELLAGLMFVDPSKDWKTHMQQLLPIENPRGMAGLAKQKFSGSYREFH